MKNKNVYKIFMIIFWSLTFISLVVPDRILIIDEVVLPILSIIFTILYIIKRWQLKKIKKKQVEELSKASTSRADINML